MKHKNCSSCGIIFQCGSAGEAGGCWCNKYPPLFTPDPLVNCMCETCLHKAIKQKIDDYVAGMTPEKAIIDNKAAVLPKAKHLVEGIDYYNENSFIVFTTWHHLKRGYCCKNACRHCPYGFKKDMV
jgi:hypothetical protein